jgi:arylsulfatase A-like enzyme
MDTNRRTFLQGAGGSLAGSGSAQAAQQPNVLLIVADQFRYDCVGANGNRLIRTRNLDRLAAGAANFSSAFVQAPVCVPSRVTLLTGRYPHSHKNRVNYTPCDSREVFLQRILRDKGYQTGSVGKLHYYPPTADHARSTGFDRVLLDDGVRETDRFSDYVSWRQAHDPRAGTYYQATASGGANPFRGAIAYEFTPTHWTGEQACRTLRDFAGSPRPFFLHCSFFKPHGPYTVPEPYDSMYNDVEIPLPAPASLEDIGKLPLPVQKQILRFNPQYNMDRKRLEWIYRSYYASVSMVDHEIGRILDELERTGRGRDTIVIFTTDHGDQLLEHGLVDKNVFFEAAVHAPLLVRFPDRVQPGRRNELVGTIDVLPTVLDLCGIATPRSVQGRSFAPLVTGAGKYSPAEAVFAENIIPEVITGGQRNYSFTPGEGIKGIRHPDAKMARTARWKFNYYPGNGAELYDLAEDPGEVRNLYAENPRSEVVRDMKDLLLEWLITGDENDQIASKWLI